MCARVRVRVSGAYILCCGRRSPRDVLMHSDSDGFVVEREAKYFFTCTYSTQSLSVSPSLTPLPLSVCLTVDQDAYRAAQVRASMKRSSTTRGRRCSGVPTQTATAKSRAMSFSRTFAPLNDSLEQRSVVHCDPVLLWLLTKVQLICAEQVRHGRR